MNTSKQQTRIFSKTAMSVAVTLLLTTFSLQVNAENRYWVGGDGNWLDTSNWSTSSGGSGGRDVRITQAWVTLPLLISMAT